MPERTPKAGARSDARPPAWKAPAALAPLAPDEGFLRAANELGIAFDDGDVERLGGFLALLLDANAAINLTAITDPAEAWTRHVLDSLTLLPFLAELPEGSRVADLGSGGGAPAMPLAIVLPGLRFTLIEATSKKVDYLREAARALGLANVEVIAERAETLGQDHRTHRAAYDALTARALGRLAVVAELAAPLLKVGGIGLFIKGAQADEEIREAEGAMKALALSWAGTHPTPTGRVVVLEKTAPTPRLYPRRPGEPARSPLR